MLVLAFCMVAAGQVKLPPYSRDVLPNGAVVYMMQKGGLPLVGFRVLVKGGMESEPAGLAGLASITAGLLRRGTANLTAARFAEELDGLGGTFSAGTDAQSTIVSAEFLKKDFDRGLAMVADAVLRPAFPEDEVGKALARGQDSLKSMKDNPGASISQFYRTFFFGAAHAYGRVPDEASYDRMRRADIVD
jgi:zinc protease